MTLQEKEYINAWLTKAEHDILSAQRLLEIEPMILDTACFHCQQAVEKYLKAYIIYNDAEVEKTHDIVFLLDLCKSFDDDFSTIEPANINAYAVRGRYPDMNLMPEKEEAQAYYQLALEIKALVLSKVDLTK